jgi:RNA polymerase sigma-70 factor (ECF subfamily)
MTAAPTDPTDEDLAKRAADRSRPRDAETGFEVLVRRYQVRLVRYLQSLNLPPDDADEVAADVWLVVWRKLPGWKPDHFRGWLFMIAKRRALDFHRKPDRAVPLAATGDLPARGWSPEDAAVDKEFVEKLRKCHDRLPEKFRTVFDEFTAGRSYAELVEALGLELGTVQSRLNRTRKKLRECVGLDRPTDEEAEL